jgi:carbon starvation protein
MAFLVCYFIWTGSIDTIWPMFGIANQLLAVVALCVVTTYLFNNGRGRFAWVSLLPLAWVLTTTMTAGKDLVFAPGFGFLDRMRQAPAGAFRWQLNTVLVAAMLALVGLIVAISIRRWIEALRGRRPMNNPAPRPSHTL